LGEGDKGKERVLRERERKNRNLFQLGRRGFRGLSAFKGKGNNNFSLPAGGGDSFGKGMTWGFFIRSPGKKVSLTLPTELKKIESFI